MVSSNKKQLAKAKPKDPSFFTEFLQFAWEKRLWWLIPLLIMLLLAAILIIIAASTPVSPFVYVLF